MNEIDWLKMNKRENFSILYKKYLFIYSKIITVFNNGKLLSTIKVMANSRKIKMIIIISNNYNNIIIKLKSILLR